MNMWSGVIQWLIEHKKCAVTLVLLVVLFVLINCYDNFMNGEIYIDNEILNELLEVDGNFWNIIYKSNMELVMQEYII